MAVALEKAGALPEKMPKILASMTLPKGLTPLMVAAFVGKLPDDILKALKEASPDLDQVDDRGITALGDSLISANLSLMQNLTKSGAKAFAYHLKNDVKTPLSLKEFIETQGLRTSHDGQFLDILLASSGDQAAIDRVETKITPPISDSVSLSQKQLTSKLPQKERKPATENLGSDKDHAEPLTNTQVRETKAASPTQGTVKANAIPVSNPIPESNDLKEKLSTLKKSLAFNKQKSEGQKYRDFVRGWGIFTTEQLWEFQSRLTTEKETKHLDDVVDHLGFLRNQRSEPILEKWREKAFAAIKQRFPGGIKTIKSLKQDRLFSSILAPKLWQTFQASQEKKRDAKSGYFDPNVVHNFDDLHNVIANVFDGTKHKVFTSIVDLGGHHYTLVIDNSGDDNSAKVQLLDPSGGLRGRLRRFFKGDPVKGFLEPLVTRLKTTLPTRIIQYELADEPVKALNQKPLLTNDSLTFSLLNAYAIADRADPKAYQFVNSFLSSPEPITNDGADVNSPIAKISDVPDKLEKPKISKAGTKFIKDFKDQAVTEAKELLRKPPRQTPMTF